MKKKGFTLIELLAVIVILAIIALIATPLVLKYIEYSKEKSAKLSANTYAEAVEKEYVSKLTNNEKMPNKEYTIKELDELGVKVKGDKPEGENDYVTLQNGDVTAYMLTIKGYVINYKDGSTTVESEKDSDSSNAGLLDYTVKFMVDGELYEIVSVREGNLISEPLTIPVKDEQFFGWWEIDGVMQEFPYKPSSDVVFNAHMGNVRYLLENTTIGTFLTIGPYKYEKTTSDVSILGCWTGTDGYTLPIIVSRTQEGCKAKRGGFKYTALAQTLTVNNETWYMTTGYGHNEAYILEKNVVDLNKYDISGDYFAAGETLVKIYLGLLPLYE